MRVLLLGWPVRHSLSPRFQNAAFQALGLDHVYALHPLERFDTGEVRALLQSPDVLGANVTVPHKAAALGCLDAVTAAGRRAGAINTVFRRLGDDGAAQLVGDNTDIEGFLADLRGVGLGGPLETAVVLGAGGAARAVVVALAGQASELVVINRTLPRASALVEQLGAAPPEGSVVQVAGWPEEPGGTELRELFERATLVVDTTSLGLGAPLGTPAFERALATLTRLPLDATPERALFYDLKYSAETPFQALAERFDRRARGGLGMLVAQGALSFERWTGLRAPLPAMCQAVGLEVAPILG